MPRSKNPLTHFLCIPLSRPSSHAALSSTISSFRAEVSSPDAAGNAPLLPAEAVRPPGSLHLTLGVMSFPKDQGLDQAVNLLRELKPREMLQQETGLDPRHGSTAASVPVTISLQGLHPMGGRTTKASILYAAPLDEQGILQRFSEAIRDRFASSGLVIDEGRPLLLHATLVRTGSAPKQPGSSDRASATGSTGQQSRRRRKVLEIDATELIARYRDRVWLEGLPLDRLAICKMGAKPSVSATGEPDAQYEVEAEIEF